MRLIPVYGPQEKEPEENRTEFYETLSIEIEKCFLSGDPRVLAGDFNTKLGYDIIQDGIHVMSPNGKLLHALMMKYNLSLLDSSEVCNDLFTCTRDCQSGKELSVLDYVFVSTDIYQQVKSMLIDEQQLFTPWRKLKKCVCDFLTTEPSKCRLTLISIKSVMPPKEQQFGILIMHRAEISSMSLQNLISYSVGYGLPVLTQKRAIGGGSIS